MTDQRLINLLCRIHRDGGHYIAEHGLDKAIEDADIKVAKLNAMSDNVKQLNDWEAVAADQAMTIAMMKAVQEPEFDRVKFERHWRKTRGEKKANRELQRHPLQPQTYIQDSANRHWVTWQAAVRSIARPASKPWVGLTDSDREELDEKYGDDTLAHLDAIEAKLKEKNA